MRSDAVVHTSLLVWTLCAAGMNVCPRPGHSHAGLYEGVGVNFNRVDRRGKTNYRSSSSLALEELPYTRSRWAAAARRALLTS